MADIHIHRPHRLGLAKARKVAWDWAEQVEQKFSMDCTVLTGETSDTVQFTRSGVKGELIVAADHFDLHAKLGFLLGAFAKTIEAEIEKNLDTLLGAAAAASQANLANPAKKAAAKTAPKVASKAASNAATKQVTKPAAAKKTPRQ